MVGVRVADLGDALAGDARDVDARGRRDLAADHDDARGQEGLAGDAAGRIIGQDRVEDGVRDLVGHLVGMTLRHGLGGEEKAFAHQAGSVWSADWQNELANPTR